MKKRAIIKKNIIEDALVWFAFIAVLPFVKWESYPAVLLAVSIFFLVLIAVNWFRYAKTSPEAEEAKIEVVNLMSQNEKGIEIEGGQKIGWNEIVAITKVRTVSASPAMLGYASDIIARHLLSYDLKLSNGSVIRLRNLNRFHVWYFLPIKPKKEEISPQLHDFLKEVVRHSHIHFLYLDSVWNKQKSWDVQADILLLNKSKRQQ